MAAHIDGNRELYDGYTPGAYTEAYEEDLYGDMYEDEPWDDDEAMEAGGLFSRHGAKPKAPKLLFPGGIIVNLIPFFILLGLMGWAIYSIMNSFGPQKKDIEVVSYATPSQLDYLHTELEAQVRPPIADVEVSAADRAAIRHFLRSEYVVKQGDSLARIAKKFGIKASTIKSLNMLKGEPVPGTMLEIPAVDGKLYVVKEGDTLSEIGFREGLYMSTIIEANNLTSDMLLVGQKLFIPRL